jgi:hypothetical protein
VKFDKGQTKASLAETLRGYVSMGAATSGRMVAQGGFRRCLGPAGVDSRWFWKIRRKIFGSIYILQYLMAKVGNFFNFNLTAEVLIFIRSMAR